MAKTLLRIKEAAAYLRVHRSVLYQWRKKRTGPPHMLAGTLVVYDRDDIDKWLEASKAAHAEAGS